MKQALAAFSLSICCAWVTQAQAADQVLEVMYSVRIRLPLSGVTQVVAENPDLLEWELVNGEVFVLGRKKGQTLLYVWTAAGVTPYVLNVTEAYRPLGQRRQRPPILRKSSDELSGFYGFQTTFPLLDNPQMPLLQQRFLTELPLGDHQVLLARGNLLSQFNPELESLNSLSLPFLQFAYQDPGLLLNLGDSHVNHPLMLLYPRLNNVKGLQVAQHDPRYRYNVFMGFDAAPLSLYQQQAGGSGLLERGYISGGSGRWQVPLHDAENLGLLAFQGLALSRLDLTERDAPGYLLAGGLEWQLQEQARLQVALGSNLEGLGLLAQGFYRHTWPGARDWFNVTGLYRHFGEHYQQMGMPQQDFVNLRLNSGFANGWSLTGGGGMRLLAGQMEDYQLTLRLGRNLQTTALNLYGQLNTWQLRQHQRRHILTLGGLWRQDLPLTGSYSWLINQSENQPDSHWHRTQLQARLLQDEQWQVSLQHQGFLQEQRSQHLFTQNLRLMASLSLSPEWLLRGNLGHVLLWPLDSTGSSEPSQLWQGGLGLDWWPDPLHQVQLAVNYQGLSPTQDLHLLSVLAGYTWRFGYDVELRQGRIQGRVFHDLNQNGLQDPDEPGLAGVQIQLRELQIETNERGDFALSGLPLRDYSLQLNSSTLPTGFQVTSDNPVLVSLKTGQVQTQFAVRQQMAIQGLVFASPLLAKGLDDVELILDGETRVKSQYGGRFYFLTTPGAHELRLDPLSIPEGYQLQGPLTRQLNSQSNLQLNFIFEPLITLELQLLERPGGPPLTKTAITATPELDPERAETALSDAQGRVSFDNLLPGTVTLQIAGQSQTLSLELPDRPGTLQRQVFLHD